MVELFGCDVIFCKSRYIPFLGDDQAKFFALEGFFGDT